MKANQKYRQIAKLGKAKFRLLSKSKIRKIEAEAKQRRKDNQSTMNKVSRTKSKRSKSNRQSQIERGFEIAGRWK